MIPIKGVKFYSYPSCTSCRRTKNWLLTEGVQFDERHLFRETPTVKELKEILSLTTNGIDEILAKRSKEFKSLHLEIENLTVNELLQLVHDKPKLLKRPILTKGEKLVIGYSEEGLKDLAACSKQ